MLAGIGIGLATQMAFSLWRSHRHSLQLAAPWRNCSMNSRGVASL
jgi:hypothetical protein